MRFNLRAGLLCTAVFVLLVGMGYWAGQRNSPTSCSQVGNLAAAFQGFNLELDSATTVAERLAHELNQLRMRTR